MARVALIDVTPEVRFSAQAALPGHEFLDVTSGAELDGAELVIAEHGDETTAAAAAIHDQGSPLLLIADRDTSVPEWIYEGRRASVLRRPFDLIDLKVKVRDLLTGNSRSAPAAALDRQAEASSAGVAPRSTGAQSPPASAPVVRVSSTWLLHPRVPGACEGFLRAATCLPDPLWLVGERGSGRRRIAMAVCESAQPPLPMLTLGIDVMLATIAERAAETGPFALFVPEVQWLDLEQQDRLAELLTGCPPFRLVATSNHDPADEVVAGTFSRRLYNVLASLTLRLPPLRERGDDMEALLTSLASRVCKLLGAPSVRFSPAALESVRAYPWPGNIIELEAVVARTLAMLVDPAVPEKFTGTIDADDLVIMPTLDVPLATAAIGEDVGEDETPRRAVVVSLEDSARRQERTAARQTEELSAKAAAQTAKAAQA